MEPTTAVDRAQPPSAEPLAALVLRQLLAAELDGQSAISLDELPRRLPSEQAS